MKKIIIGIFMILALAQAEIKSIILGGGCFWCTEAVFERVDGVSYTEVGYTGGKANPTYQSVTRGDGNVEVARIYYNDEKISLEKILDLFFKMHDPTSLNRQGADVGPQYASAIFYESKEDLAVINAFIAEQSKIYTKPIVTQVKELKEYTKAEEYHQKYFKKNPNQAYCQFVIAPKIKKVFN